MSLKKHGKGLDDILAERYGVLEADPTIGGWSLIEDFGIKYGFANPHSVAEEMEKAGHMEKKKARTIDGGKARIYVREAKK